MSTTTIEAFLKPDATIARAKAPTGNPTLPQSVLAFSRHWSPRVLVVGFAIELVLRLLVGGLSPWDLAVVAGFIAWQPLQEWLIHVYILHWRPRRILGVWIDPMLARVHRAHHVDPWDEPTLFIPLSTIAFSFFANLGLLFWLMPTTGLALTGLLSITGVGIFYEWIHFLVHTAYRPRSKWYRKVWKYHRLHHFKNENYWMGVTMHQGDWLFGTMPPPRSVETSPTARDLGGMKV
jgi:hypothetical protein